MAQNLNAKVRVLGRDVRRREAEVERRISTYSRTYNHEPPTNNEQP